MTTLKLILSGIAALSALLFSVLAFCYIFDKMDAVDPQTTRRMLQFVAVVLRTPSAGPEKERYEDLEKMLVDCWKDNNPK